MAERRQPDNGFTNWDPRASVEAIQAAYQKYLGRQPGADEIEQWFGKGDFERGIAQSDEGRRYGVQSAYRQYLGRDANDDEIGQWVNNPDFERLIQQSEESRQYALRGQSNPAATGAAAGGGGFASIEGDWNNPTLDMIKAYGRSRGVEMNDQQAGYWVQQWPNLMRETPGDLSYALMRLEKADEWTSADQRYGGAGGGAGLGVGDLIKPFTEQFTYADFVAPDAASLDKDPGFQASIDKAKDTLQRSAAARGSLLSGSTLQDLSDRTASMTQDAYQNLYGRELTNYNTNRSNQFDQYAQRRANFYQNQDSPFAKLYGLAQLESGDRNAYANQQLGWAQLGANTIAGGSNTANQYGTSGANATAAGQAASGNAYSSLFGGLSQIPWYLQAALGGNNRATART